MKMKSDAKILWIFLQIWLPFQDEIFWEIKKMHAEQIINKLLFKRCQKERYEQGYDVFHEFVS